MKRFRVTVGMIESEYEAMTEGEALLRHYRDAGYGPGQVWLDHDGTIAASPEWIADFGEPAAEAEEVS